MSAHCVQTSLSLFLPTPWSTSSRPPFKTKSSPMSPIKPSAASLLPGRCLHCLPPALGELETWNFGNQNYVLTALSSQYQATTDWSKGKPPRSAKTAMYTITWQTLIVRFLCTWRSKLYCCVVWISLVSLSVVFSLIVHNCQTVKKKWKWEIAMIMI